ncbi:ATP-binding protein [Methylobacterium sp. 10]|uniref:ATP-binding protein n=1 Tax=Methylobacterium sp. 10 TaxID=1101191 RepID=UPI0012DC9728|nr:ATP-binding protein [Methylobacterium sp. 10]
MRQAVHAPGSAGRKHTQPGLGLAIVRQTAQALDHRITVRSVEGVGSRFSVTVPCADRPDDGTPRRRVEAREGRWTRLS